MKTKPFLLWFAFSMVSVLVFLRMAYGSFAKLLPALAFGCVPLHDYRYFFYPMGAQVLADPRPIDGFLYSPFAALFFIPFGRLPYAVSAAAWTALLLLMVLLLAHEAIRFAAAELWLARVGILAVSSAFPVLHDLRFGQVALLLVVSLLACARLYRRGNVVAAAASLAFAVSFKAYPVLFLSYFVFKRDWRFVGLFAAFMLLALAVLPIAMLGASNTWAFYANVSAQLDQRFGAGIHDANSQSLQSIGERILFAHVNFQTVASRLVISGVRYGLCGALMVAVYRCARKPGSARVDEAFMWLFVATPFFVATSWPHYFVYLPVVATFVLGRVGAEVERNRATQLARVAAWCSLALSSIVFFRLVGDRHAYAAWGALFVSNACALLALTWLSTSQRPTAREPRSPA